MAVPAEIRRNTTLVAVAAALYLLGQTVLAGFARPLGPFERAIFGAIATEDLWVVRLGMMLVSTGALFLAFRCWVRPGGKASWAAAGFFAVSWAPVSFGGEIRPEVLAALACVAAAGTTTRWLVERDRATLVAAAAAVAVAVVLMPVLGAVLAAVLAVVVGVWARGGGGPALIALGVGVVTGRVLAGVLRTGTVGRRIADVEAGLTGAGLGQLHTLLEPARVSGAADGLAAAAVWRSATGAAVVVALAVLAVVWWRWPHRRNAARTGVAVGAALLVAGLLVPHEAPLAFLPSYALLSIPVGAGLLAAWRATRDTGVVLATLLYVAVVLLFVGWQASVTVGTGP